MSDNNAAIKVNIPALKPRLPRVTPTSSSSAHVQLMYVYPTYPDTTGNVKMLKSVNNEAIVYTYSNNNFLFIVFGLKGFFVFETI